MTPSDLDLPLLPSAEQIKRREFATVRRGYDPDQVRDYLQQVATQVETLEKGVREARMDAEHRAARTTGPMTPIAEAAPTEATAAAPTDDMYERLAKRFAGVIAGADREATKVLDEAKAEAARVLEQARAEADRIRLDAQARAEEARQQGSEALAKAKEEADRILGSLAERRETLVNQMQEMQTTLLNVAQGLAIPFDDGASERGRRARSGRRRRPRRRRPRTLGAGDVEASAAFDDDLVRPAVRGPVGLDRDDRPSTSPIWPPSTSTSTTRPATGTDRPQLARPSSTPPGRGSRACWDNPVMAEGIDGKLDAIEARHDEVAAEMASARRGHRPRSPPRPWASATPSSARWSAPTASTSASVDRREEARALAKAEHDAEMAAYFRDEADRLDERVTTLRAKLEALLVPADPNEGKDLILEIRAGTGGEEAALWAGELFEMYRRLAERHRWKTEVIASSPSDLGGFKEVSLEVRGEGRVRVAQARGGRPPRAARPGHRVAGPHPHLDGDGRGHARGRGDRGRSSRPRTSRSTCTDRAVPAASR